MSSGNTDKSPSPGKSGKPTNAPNHSATYLRKKQIGKSINIISKDLCLYHGKLPQDARPIPFTPECKDKGLRVGKQVK